MHQTNRILFIIVRAEGIGTHHFPQITGLMGESFYFRPHFVNGNRHPELCGLPSSFAPGHTSANYVQSLCHEMRCNALIYQRKGISLATNLDPAFL